MTDLLIPNIDAHLEQQLERSARRHRRSLSEEARILLERALIKPADKRKMGTTLSELVPRKYRGDDLVFEVPRDPSHPPKFK